MAAAILDDEAFRGPAQKEGMNILISLQEKKLQAARCSLPASRRRVNANIIPMPSPRASIEDPPYDKNGRVIPLVGIRWRLDAMLMTA